MKQMPMEDYLRLKAWSAGDLETLLERCPAAAHAGSAFNPDRELDFSTAADLGTIAHSIVCEKNEGAVDVIDPKDYPAKTTGAIPEGWTNNAIRSARDQARAVGKIPVLLSDMARVRTMAAAVRAFIERLRAAEPAVALAYEKGLPERVLEWTDPIGNLPCKIRPDILAPDFSIIIDFKFTERSAEPESYSLRAIANGGGYMRAAFYRRGVQMTQQAAPCYLFVVTEQEAPHLSSCVGVDPRGMEIGEQRVEHALSTLAVCVERNEFPSYPARVVYPEVPPWVESRWLAKQVEAGIPYDISKLFQRSTP